MKQIIKGRPHPEHLKMFYKTPNKKWIDISKGLKNKIRCTLLMEQSYVCAYCGKRINNKHDTEIDHVMPKTVTTCLHNQICHYNLVASCKGSSEIRDVEKHCNNKKGDNILPIHPLTQNCQDYFIYDHDGGVQGTTPAAKRTIELLNLKAPQLINIRREALSPYINLNPKEAIKELSNILEKRDEKLNEYYFVIEKYIKDFILMAS